MMSHIQDFLRVPILNEILQKKKKKKFDEIHKLEIDSRYLVAPTLMAHLPWLFQTRN